MFETLEEVGVGKPHTVKVFFELPYRDWCLFQKSELFRCLKEYLEELEKRDIPKQRPSLVDLLGEWEP